MEQDFFQQAGFASADSDVEKLLFSDNWLLFRHYVKSAKIYSEWGSGLSTLYAADQDNIEELITVETDPLWASKVSDVLEKYPKNFKVRHIDLGPVGEWGRPESYSKIENVKEYCSAPFAGKHQPDLILIDGRFRVHCFLETLLKSKAGTRVIFDDYVNRPRYHIVERFLEPTEVAGRQALFIVKIRASDRWRIRKLSKLFSYVMD